MASDISNIIKTEISSTLESLLSATSSVEDVELVSSPEDNKAIKTTVEFEHSAGATTWNYFVPTATATKFEYLMLGGVTDLKDDIDDEITDAVKEIISTISSSIVTSVNAQGFPDISGMKSTLKDTIISSTNDVDSDKQLYKFKVSLNDDELLLYIEFDSSISKFIEQFVGKPAVDNSVASDISQAGGSIINSLLGEESADNLRLLFDIKMRLSVRLGTKICLLRDVISWDIGEIIELSQMTSEPLDILVNGVVIGTGEAIIVDGKFGVKIKTIGKAKIN